MRPASTFFNIQLSNSRGEDELNNLACTCYPCNLFKGNILPDDFMERITEIFLYQLEKKYKSKLKWKIIHKILNKML